jgi:hypothetical protein
MCANPHWLGALSMRGGESQPLASTPRRHSVREGREARGFFRAQDSMFAYLPVDYANVRQTAVSIAHIPTCARIIGDSETPQNRGAAIKTG